MTHLGRDMSSEEKEIRVKEARAEELEEEMF